MEKPYIEKVRNLVDHMRAGRIQVPNFQRPFVWTDEQRLELLHSIRDGIPIGGILVWKTSAHELACYPQVGPHPMAPPPKLPEGLRQYLLDGHQRMSTLFGALWPTPEDWRPTEGEPDWRMVYDLREREFRIVGERAPRAWEMPAWLLHNRDAHRKFVRNLARTVTEAEAGRLEEEADRIATSFDEYEVPVIPLSTDDLDVATRTFQRVNSMGTAMDEADMVMALTWRPDFELRKHLDDVRAAMPEGWQELEDRGILNVCKGLFGMEINKAAEERLARRLMERPEVLEDAKVRIARAVDVLEGFGVPGLDLLPYQLQWVCFALALEAEPDAEARGRMERWFWWSTDSGAFAGASSTMVRRLVESLAEWANGTSESFPGRALAGGKTNMLDRFDFRAAWCRAFALRLARGGPRRPDGEVLDGRALLKERGRGAILHLFPRSDLTAAQYASAANRVMALPEDLPALRAGALSGELAEGVLRSLMLPPVRWSAGAPSAPGEVLGRRSLLFLLDPLMLQLGPTPLPS